MTKLTPKNIQWAIADDKIIKKFNDGTFAEVTASDITAFWFTIWGGLPATFTVLWVYVTPTWWWLQAISQAVPAWTKIINMYSFTSNWDISWTLYRWGAIQTLLNNPWAWAVWVTWDIVLDTLSWSLFIPWWNNYTFEFLS